MHVRKFLACWTLSILLLTPPVWAGPQGELPQGPGRDLVEENCTACHTQAIILQNHMTRDRWNETITWMQEKQGLWELEPKVRDGILDYLAEHQGPGDASQDKTPWQNPMYRYDYKPNPL